MERHGRIAALQALCDEARIEYREPDNLWQCYEKGVVYSFLDDLVGFPKAGSALESKKTGAEGELLLLGSVSEILRNTETYIILSRYVTAPHYSEKGSRQPDMILLTRGGLATIESKTWHSTGGTKFDEGLAEAHKQIGEATVGLETLVKRCIKREETGVVPIVYNYPGTLTEKMFPPYKGRRIYLARRADEVVQAVIDHGTHYSEDELYDLKEAILALPTRAPPRDDYHEEGLECFSNEDYPDWE